MAYVKGAPKKIIALSQMISIDGEPKPFPDEEKEKIIKIHDELAASGLRILAMAYRDLPPDFDDYHTETVERDLVFLWHDGHAGPPTPRGETRGGRLSPSGYPNHNDHRRLRSDCPSHSQGSGNRKWRACRIIKGQRT